MTIKLPKDYINFKKIGILKSDGTIVRLNNNNLRKMTGKTLLAAKALKNIKEYDTTI
jgi:hypothetical protein